MEADEDVDNLKNSLFSSLENIDKFGADIENPMTLNLVEQGLDENSVSKIEKVVLTTIFEFEPVVP